MKSLSEANGHYGVQSREGVIKCALHTLYFELYHNVPNGLVGFDSLACYFTTW